MRRGQKGDTPIKTGMGKDEKLKITVVKIGVTQDDGGGTLPIF
jgi:hypothetical protein